MGIIHQNARGDSCQSSSESCMGTDHPNPESTVIPHIELKRHPEKAEIIPKIKVL